MSAPMMPVTPGLGREKQHSVRMEQIVSWNKLLTMLQSFATLDAFGKSFWGI